MPDRLISSESKSVTIAFILSCYGLCEVLFVSMGIETNVKVAMIAAVAWKHVSQKRDQYSSNVAFLIYGSIKI